MNSALLGFTKRGAGLLLAIIFFLSLSCQMAWGQSHNFRKYLVTRDLRRVQSASRRDAADATAAASCVNNTIAADTNGDQKLNQSEYATFIDLESGGVVSEPFKSLPVVFVLIFYTIACDTCFRDTGYDKCCVGDSAFIPIDPVSVEYPTTIGLLCSLVTPEIEALTAKPSLAPVTLPPVTSEAPSLVPVSLPPVASEEPSGVPSPRVSDAPSIVPSMSPNAATSSAPSINPLLCIEFGFTYDNQRGLTADDIFHMVNNTLKTGFEIATRNITIGILNTTFPSANVSLAAAKSVSFGVSESGASRAFQLALVDQFGTKMAAEIISQWNFDSVVTHDTPGQGRRRELRSSQPRRLVYYTDDIPVTVDSVIENPICPGMKTNPLYQCAIVQCTVCVVLEMGDDPVIVRQALVTGLKEAIDNGSFEAAIPPENLS